MSKMQGIAGLLRKEIRVKFPVSNSDSGELVFEDGVVKLDFLTVPHFARLLPLIDSDTKKKLKDVKDVEEVAERVGDDDFSGEQLAVMSEIIFDLIVRDENTKDLSDADVNALISLNVKAFVSGFVEMVKTSISFLSDSDKKKIVKEAKKPQTV